MTKTDAELRDLVAAVFSHLDQPEVREQLRRQQAKTDAYFRELRKAMTPTLEQLHRPFTI